MSLLDLFGFITGAICVYMIVKENDWNWIIGVLNSVILLIVFWKANLFAQVGLQALYVIEGFFGWYKWTRKDDTGEKIIKIKRTSISQYMLFSIIIIVFTGLFWKIFLLTSDPSPLVDSLITVASIVAELMLCWKLYESWILYLLTDIVSIVLYISMGLYLTSGTYVCLLILCVMGFIRWNKIYRKNSRILKHI